ncbi:MAG: hypothetical protein ACRERC_16990 [Candidatus Binatia bacterium]
MLLDRESLFQACYEVARQTMSERRPIDADHITALARQFAEIAAGHEEFVVGQGCDPELITRAVVYLASAHAIPPMRDDTGWFAHMLAALVELACPNTIVGCEQELFFRDIEAGIATARSRYED